ncbi:MAG: hypothetical protein QME41_09550, partial [Actinomycetota bacterium]|nr:hypothetical protein [Actinomycetota bacterium]
GSSIAPRVNRQRALRHRLMISGQIANNLIKTHPYVILGEEIHENPFFIRPEKFLKGYQPEGRFYT